MKKLYILTAIAFSIFNLKANAGCPVSTPPNVSASSVCGIGNTILSASLTDPANTIVWADSAGRIIGSGISYSHFINSPGLSFTAIETGFDNLTVSVGPQPSAFTGTYPSQNYTNGLFFNSSSPIKIDSITLRTNNPLTGFIQFWSKAPEDGGYLLQKVPFHITDLGVTNTKIPVGVILNSGNYYASVEVVSGTGILFRALDGAAFPYSVGGLISITGTNVPSDPDRYYYLYDWKVSKMCFGPASQSISPTIQNTLSKTLPYNETFNEGVPCDWNMNGWMGGSSANLSSSGFTIPFDEGLVASNDDACMCDKSNSTFSSPYFDLRNYSSAANINLSFDYVYKELQSSKVYVRITAKNSSVSVLDSLNPSASWASYSRSLSQFVLLDSVQVSIEHRDHGGDGSAVALNNFNITDNCNSNYILTVDVTTDIYASEISWTVRDVQSNAIVAQSIPYEDIDPYNILEARKVNNICLTRGRNYVFKITDVFGDGMNDGTNTGKYLITNNCNDTLLSGTDQLPFNGLMAAVSDSIAFTAENYTVSLGADISIFPDDTLILDAGDKGPYLWSTGDTTRHLTVLGDMGTGIHAFNVVIREGTACESRDSININIVTYENSRVIVNLVTDSKGSDIRWEIRDETSNILLYSKGPFNDVIPYHVDSATHTDTLYFPYHQMLVFKIIDISGDGLNDGINQGSVTLGNECIPIILRNNSQTFPFTEGTTRFDSIKFLSNQIPVIDLGADRELCDGDSITILSNVSANQYNWSTGQTTQNITIQSNQLFPGVNYIILSTEAGECFATDTIIIHKNIRPSSSYNMTINNPRSVTFTAAEINGLSYEWDFGDGQTGTGNPASHTYATGGTFITKLKVVSQKNCINEENKTLILPPVGIDKHYSSFKLYPNPAKEKLHLLSNYATAESIKITDLQGRLLKEISGIKTPGIPVIIDIQDLSSGIYNITIISSEGKANMLFLKEK